MSTQPAGERPFVGRGGLKLDHALRHFELDARGLSCADLGCNVGGFTDCLLHAGAAGIVAIDTGYGVLDYRLRIDPRVTVLERTNALHAQPPEAFAAGVDLVVIDMGWTVQKHCIPAALRWLKPDDDARIITLIKPHYEAKGAGMDDRLSGGVLEESVAAEVLDRVMTELPTLGVDVLGVTRSPIAGGATKGNKRGNTEYLALLKQTDHSRPQNKEPMQAPAT